MTRTGRRGAALFFSLLLAALLFPAPVRAAETQEEAVQLPIIMYHNLSDKGLGDIFTLSPDDFEADLAWLQAHGYESISLSQLLDFVYNGVALPEKPVMLTFDDSFESFLLLACPLLERYNARALVNVLGWPAEALADPDNHGLPYSALNWEQIRALSGNPHVEFGNHSYNLHSQEPGGRLGCRILPGEDLQHYETLLYNDLDKLQQYLSVYTGSAPLAFAYPFGADCAEALPVLKLLGFKAAFNTEGRINSLCRGDREALFDLGRFNRPSGPDSESFFSGTVGLA